MRLNMNMRQVHRMFVFGLLAGVLLNCGKLANPIRKRTVVAEVDAERIYADELGREIGPLRKELPAGPEASASLDALKSQLLQRRIDQVVLLNEARKRHLRVPESDVDLEIARIKKEEAEHFQPFLRENYFDFADFRAKIEERMLTAKFLESEVNPRILVSDEEVSQYYADHQDDFRVKEKVHCQQIFSRSEERLKEAQKELKKGKNFELVAKSLSEAPEAAKGGDLGVFGKGEMPEVLETSCFALRRGGVSGVVKSDYGFHLFRVLQTFVAEKRSLEQVREEVGRILLRQKRDKFMTGLMDELKVKTRVMVKEKVLRKI